MKKVNQVFTAMSILAGLLSPATWAAEQKCFNIEETYNRITNSDPSRKVAVGLSGFGTDPYGQNTLLLTRNVLDQLEPKFGFSGVGKEAWQTVVDAPAARAMLNIKLEQFGCKYLAVTSAESQTITYEIISDELSEIDNESAGRIRKHLIHLREANSNGEPFAIEYRSQQFPEDTTPAETLSIPAGEATYSLDHTCDGKVIKESRVIRMQMSVGIDSTDHPFTGTLSSEWSDSIRYWTGPNHLERAKKTACKQLTGQEN